MDLGPAPPTEALPRALLVISPTELTRLGEPTLEDGLVRSSCTVFLISLLTRSQVLESWITPSLFKATGNDAIIDEWTFGELQDNETALAALTQHWETWYTEQDFKDMAAAG